MLHADGRDVQPAQMVETPVVGHAKTHLWQVAGQWQSCWHLPWDAQPSSWGTCPTLQHHTFQSQSGIVLASMFDGLIFHTVCCCYHPTPPSVFLLTLSKASHLLPAIKAAKCRRQKPHDWPQLQGCWMPLAPLASAGAGNSSASPGLDWGRGAMAGGQDQVWASEQLFCLAVRKHKEV